MERKIRKGEEGKDSASLIQEVKSGLGIVDTGEVSLIRVNIKNGTKQKMKSPNDSKMKTLMKKKEEELMKEVYMEKGAGFTDTSEQGFATEESTGYTGTESSEQTGGETEKGKIKMQGGGTAERRSIRDAPGGEIEIDKTSNEQVIQLDSGKEQEEMDVTLVSTPNTKRKHTSTPDKRTKRGAIPKTTVLSSESEDEYANLTYNQKKLVAENVEGIEIRNASDIGAEILGWLEEVDRARTVSKNIKGSQQGIMKTRVNMSRQAVKVFLIERAAGGEARRWKGMAREKDIEITTLKMEIERLRARAEGTESSKRKRRGTTAGILPEQGKSENDMDITDVTTDDGNEQITEEFERRPKMPRREVSQRKLEEELRLGVEGAIGGRRTSAEKEVSALISRFAGGIRDVIRGNMERAAVREGAGMNSRRMQAQSGTARQSREAAHWALTTEASWTGGESERERERSNGRRNAEWTNMQRQGNRRGGEGMINVEPARGGIGRRANYTIRQNELYPGYGNFNYGDNENRGEYDGEQVEEWEIPRRNRVRPPRAAAVVITSIGDMTYADIMTRAKTQIKLNEIGIGNMKIRRAITGAIILEIEGENQNMLADRLAEKLSNIFDNNEVTIKGPVKTTEFLLSGLDDSITKEEIVRTVAMNSGLNASTMSRPNKSGKKWNGNNMGTVPNNRCEQSGSI